MTNRRSRHRRKSGLYRCCSSSAAQQFNLMIEYGDMTDLIHAREYYANGLTIAYE